MGTECQRLRRCPHASVAGTADLRAAGSARHAAAARCSALPAGSVATAATHRLLLRGRRRKCRGAHPHLLRRYGTRRPARPHPPPAQPLARTPRHPWPPGCRPEAPSPRSQPTHPLPPPPRPAARSACRAAPGTAPSRGALLAGVAGVRDAPAPPTFPPARPAPSCGVGRP